MEVPHEEKNRKWKSIKIALFSFFTVLLAVGGLYFYQQHTQAQSSKSFNTSEPGAVYILKEEVVHTVK